MLAEGKNPASIFVTGNTVIDAMQHTVVEDYSHPELDWVGDLRYIFIIAYKREIQGEPMHDIFRAIRRVLDEHPDVKAIYPIYMNPVFRKKQMRRWRMRLLWGWACVRADCGCAGGERVRGVEGMSV